MMPLADTSFAEFRVSFRASPDFCLLSIPLVSKPYSQQFWPRSCESKSPSLHVPKPDLRLPPPTVARKNVI